MGFFSNLFSKKQERPQIQVPTAQELLTESLGFMRGAFPQFTQARETGLAALMGQGFAPQLSFPAVDYSQFAPTTFEQGLATSAFQPLIEQAQRQAMHIGSLAGLPSAAPAHFGRAIAPAIQNIGQFLAGQQQQRAMTEQERLINEVLSSEAARQFNIATAVGQDPYQELLAGAGLGAQQAQRIGQEQLAQWEAEPEGGGGGALLGMLGGAIAAPFTGGLSLLPAIAAGGAIGGGIEQIFGGAPSPVSFGDATSIYQASKQPSLMDLLKQLGIGGGGAGAGQVGATVPIGGGFGGITPEVMFPNLGF